jgi:hypothetical protein
MLFVDYERIGLVDQLSGQRTFLFEVIKVF